MADYLVSLVKRGVISEDAAARMMTHQAEQPNPVRPIIDAARGYLQSGDYNPVHNPGTEPKDYLQELLRNPDILAKNIQQAGNFAGISKGITKGFFDKAIREGLAAGKSFRDVANELGISHQAVKFQADNLGLKSSNKIGRPYGDDAPDWFRDEMKQ